MSKPTHKPTAEPAPQPNFLESIIQTILTTQPQMEKVLEQGLPKFFETPPKNKPPKRPPGRPRIHPKPDPNAPKRPPGRPRIHPKPDGPKRPPGRPRIHPKPDPSAPKRPPGRPRIHPKVDAPKRPPGRPKTSTKQETPDANPPAKTPLEEEGTWIWGQEDIEAPLPFQEEPLWAWIDIPEEPLALNTREEESLSLDDMEFDKISELLFVKPQFPDPDQPDADDAPIILEDDPPKPLDDPEEDIKAIQKDQDSEPLDIYYREIRNHPPLTREEEQTLSKKYREEGCMASRDKMIHANLKLVVHIAKRFRGMLRMFSSSMSFADLVSEGNIGLMRAIEKYEPDRGNKISTYASWWIVQQIQSAIQKQGKLIRIPTHLLQKMRKIQRILDEYQQSHPEEGRPNLEKIVPPELKALLESSGFRIQDAIQIRGILSMSAPSVSLDDAKLNQSKSGGEDGPSLHDCLKDENAKSPYQESAASGETDRLSEMLQTLTPKERAVITDRFGLDGAEEQTLEEVGKKHNLTRERIRQIQDKVLKKLRTKLTENKGLPASKSRE